MVFSCRVEVVQAAWPPRLALASRPGSLPYMGLGNHAPADTGGNGYSVF